MSWLTEPWTYPFMRWALVTCLVLAGIHAYLGFHVIRRGVLFVDLAMAQMAALGAAVGVVLGLEHDTVGEYLLSCGFALVTAVLFATLRSRRIPIEAVIAIFYGIASAATFVVLEHSPHGMEEVKHLFVGQVLTVDPRHIVSTSALYLVIAVILRAMHSRILAVSENGVGPGTLVANLVFYGAFALVVTSSVGLVGVLLVFALLVLPAVAAHLLPASVGTQLLWGWVIAGTGCVVGLHAAFLLDQPAAPVIVLALGALVLAFALATRSRRRVSRETGSPEG